MAKTGRKNKVYGAKFKMGVLLDMWEHHLEYGEIVRKYWDIKKGGAEYKNTV